MVRSSYTYPQAILKAQKEGDTHPIELNAFKEAMYRMFAANPIPEQPASLKQVEPKSWSRQRAERSRIKHCKSDLEILLRAKMCRVPLAQVQAIHTVIYG